MEEETRELRRRLQTADTLLRIVRVKLLDPVVSNAELIYLHELIEKYEHNQLDGAELQPLITR